MIYCDIFIQCVKET